ncbi:hypothetical protein [Flavobacterium sp.]|uniref:hypothetical protein n=1 Tax=Flavobacterium sp. TaxID=239 RepID=UPI001200DC51|nr:hypothetical protein [Flavobacterium sp.]RZJ71203.1 MAG: hypothetical protein EOO49_10655 [Flavobacterium sp.]
MNQQTLSTIGLIWIVAAIVICVWRWIGNAKSHGKSKIRFGIFGFLSGCFGLLSYLFSLDFFYNSIIRLLPSEPIAYLSMLTFGALIAIFLASEILLKITSKNQIKPLRNELHDIGNT